MYFGVSPLRQIDQCTEYQVVSGTLLQWAIYGDHPSPTAFVGMIIIVVCGKYAAVSRLSKDIRMMRKFVTRHQMYGTIVEDKGQIDEEETAVEEVNIPLLRTGAGTGS